MYGICFYSSSTQVMHDAKLWHARFGHVNYGSLLLLQKHGKVEHMPHIELPPKYVCEGCVLGKMHKYAFFEDRLVRFVQKLQLIDSDVCGPMQTPSLWKNM